jgi:hypothetical protein
VISKLIEIKNLEKTLIESKSMTIEKSELNCAFINQSSMAIILKGNLI